MADLKEEILKYVAAARDGQLKDKKILREYDPKKSSEYKHQLLFFFKPELTTDATVKLDAISDLVFDNFAKKEISVGAVAVLPGEYLKEKDIMIQHYGVIAYISKNGEQAISESAKAVLQEKFKAQLDAGAQVLGGHQFLDKFPDISAYALSVLNDNLGTTRLGSGTYAMNIKVDGKPYIVLNPFHAYQLVPYTSPKRSIVLLELLTNAPWSVLRNEVCGVTDPSAADASSLRNQLLQKKTDFGLLAVDKSCNGIHMSAGPLEAMVELQRFFEVDTSATSFGRKLSEAGVSDERIGKLKQNAPLEKDGKTISAFDATEEKDADEAVTILK